MEVPVTINADSAILVVTEAKPSEENNNAVQVNLHFILYFLPK